MRQCLPGSRGANPARHAEDAVCGSGLARWRRDTLSCPAHVRAVDAPVCSVAAHAAGPYVVTAKGPASTASWFELGGAVAAAVLASNMSGIYALQAIVVIDRMAAANVARFRRRHGLQVNTDFAYAFASWAEARDAGGQAIADAWSELRMDFEEKPPLRPGGGGTAQSPFQPAGEARSSSTSQQ